MLLSELRKTLSLLTALLVLGACQSPQGAQGGRVQFEADESPPNSPGRSPGRPGGILEFTAPKLGGGQVVGREFAGKSLAIWFWAPW